MQSVNWDESHGYKTGRVIRSALKIQIKCQSDLEFICLWRGEGIRSKKLRLRADIYKVRSRGREESIASQPYFQYFSCDGMPNYVSLG